jgi:hypothetical protein
MKLPNGNRAVVEISKLCDYCLNPGHPIGKHKARVFASALGLIADDAVWLQQALLDAAAKSEVTEGAVDRFGTRYWMKCTMLRGTHQAVVCSAWIVQSEVDVPRLITCYVQLP